MVDVSEMRHSMILRGRSQQEQKRTLPPAVGSEGGGAMSSAGLDGDIAPNSNGQQPRTKQEDHYGFLYSMSEADVH